MKAHKAQCFYAVQKKHDNIETSALVEDADGKKTSKIVSKNGKQLAGASSLAEAPAGDPNSMDDMPDEQAEVLTNDEADAPPDEANVFLRE